MSVHIPNRDHMLEQLQRELLGPAPSGDIADISALLFEEEEKFYAPHQQPNGEEILQIAPLRRYGVGILYPWGTSADDQMDEEKREKYDERSSEVVTKEAQKDMEKIANREVSTRDLLEDMEGEFDLSSANAMKPSSLGVSLRAEFPEGSKLIVRVKGGRYKKTTARLRKRESVWWARSAVEFTAELSDSELLAEEGTLTRQGKIVSSSNLDGLDLRVEVISRSWRGRERLITVCLVNRMECKKGQRVDENCFFQTHFEVAVVSSEGERYHILPYPEAEKPETQYDEEEKSIALLYRDLKTYGVGHGCAADWGRDKKDDRVSKISAEVIPTYEAPSITPDVERKDGTPLTVSMVSLAGWDDESDGVSDLEEVINLYNAWIDEKRSEGQAFDGILKDAVDANMEECKLAAKRMREGLDFLKSDDDAMLSFRLTNRAMLMQQVVSQQKPRDGRFENDIVTFEESFSLPDYKKPPKGRGNWRAFQIAFLLMSLKSAVDDQGEDRERVDLIWFPTGGGKTEAYLGLAAFSMFYHRIKEPKDDGVHVLMRYTLRLLTAQQFQRAAKLICAMEVIRQEYEEKMGKKEFSIGIWVGGDTTPNTRKNALTALRKLKNGEEESVPFVLRHCPWCGAQFGVYNTGKRSYGRGTPKKKQRVVFGYGEAYKTVVMECPDQECHFAFRELPVYVIDEDVYEKKPTLVIGTVDKFAMLAWRPEARALFGLDDGGQQVVAPPKLIIQDELHLISGPLGSMAGLYETVIEELCTDRRNNRAVRPKIVCSTATIRQYKTQVESLYARDKVSLFPAPGIDVSDSFFSQYAKDKVSGELAKGRKYVGIHAPALGSLLTAEVRTFASMLQAPVDFNHSQRDPWWTLLVFFNSLRELGTGLTLFQSDIPDYMGTLRQRLGLNWSQMRKFGSVKELTSRLSSDAVTEAIDILQVATTDKNPVDVCLASNIIEVGVDIDRLSMMAIVGQPKTTAQYIQVSGRVGRRWNERPGLVLMLYAASKPRDRSHFERFRTYHERLYAQVEPTTVTPFSPPVLDRALHALMVSYVRQKGIKKQPPYPFPQELLDELEPLLIKRVDLVDDYEAEQVREVFEERCKEWRKWQPEHWERKKQDEGIPLMRLAGSYVPVREQELTWSTPMSMRNVDASCEGYITTLYVNDESE